MSVVGEAGFYPVEGRKEIILTGKVPSAFNPPSGCRFHPRCGYVLPVCPESEPPLKEVAPGHHVACHLFDTC
jgi:oligopeptide transport system ATP-binding protein